MDLCIYSNDSEMDRNNEFSCIETFSLTIVFLIFLFFLIKNNIFGQNLDNIGLYEIYIEI